MVDNGGVEQSPRALVIWERSERVQISRRKESSGTWWLVPGQRGEKYEMRRRRDASRGEKCGRGGMEMDLGRNGQGEPGERAKLRRSASSQAFD